MTTPPFPPQGPEPVLAETVDHPSDGRVRSRLVDNRWFILGILFCVTLFLGFPVLWWSRAFSRPAKVAITILVCIETVFVFWAFYAIMLWCWQRISDSL